MKRKLAWKVCGMREPENISQVLALEPHLLGFIFYEKSARFVGKEFDLNRLPWKNHTKKVGVFVNQEKEVLDTARGQNLDYVQLHGSESPAFCQSVKEAGFGVLKAFAVDEGFDFKLCEPYQKMCDYLLFDTKLPRGYGGHGESFDWGLLERYSGERPFLLAGGISTGNLKNLIKVKHPKFVGIDVNSRFETQPAMKDLQMLTRVRNFISHWE